jgi:hypothetical protein
MNRNVMPTATPVLSIPGLRLRPGALDADTQEAILKWIQAPPGDGSNMPWEISSEGRRVAQFGARYDFGRQEVDLSCEDVPAVPPQLLSWLGADNTYTQCIINEYEAEHAIPWHTDHSLFGESILVYCLGETRPVRLRPTPTPTPTGRGHRSSADAGIGIGAGTGEQEFPMASGCGYEMTGECRWHWQHCIPAGQGRCVCVTLTRSLTVCASLSMSACACVSVSLTPAYTLY